MMNGNRLAPAILALIIPAILISCASKPFLKVQYQLPSPSTELTDESLYLEISDRRNDPAFLSTSAKKSLEDFNDTYSLVVLQADGSGNLLGAYDLDSLWRELFNQRLQNEGVTVSPAKDGSKASLEIQIKVFKLDIVDRKWVLHMRYQAGLSKNNTLRAKESVSGSAERLKLLGKHDAEKILGELVTDMVNKLDVAQLFRQAR